VSWPIAGIIEGFYGKPWSWDERANVMRWCHERGMTDYIYAPKDDPKHRERWREPYGTGKLDGFARLVAEKTLRVGFGISPGLSIDCYSDEDRAALLVKIDQVLATGIDVVVLALDDIPFGGREQGVAHAALTTWLRDHLGSRASLVLVPTEYVGTGATPYLTALAAGVPDDVPIAWTGSMVVNAAITADEARARTDALGGRPPLIWDNFPVNDGMMRDRLHLGPLWGRDPKLDGLCSGYVANPMVQPMASKLPLASIAGWLRGEDPIASWVAAAEELDGRVLAEACDGAVPGALVASAIEWLDDDQADAKVAPLRAWLDAALTCTAGAFGEEVQPWVDQVHAEAKVGLDALRLIDAARRGDHEKVVGHGFGTAMGAASLRKADCSVMGPRWGFQPALGQRPDGTWSFSADSLLTDSNAIDELVQAALAFASSRSAAP
jgi:hyaluronoglucosaminidase